MPRLEPIETILAQRRNRIAGELQTYIHALWKQTRAWQTNHSQALLWSPNLWLYVPNPNRPSSRHCIALMGENQTTKLQLESRDLASEERHRKILVVHFPNNLWYSCFRKARTSKIFPQSISSWECNLWLIVRSVYGDESKTTNQQKTSSLSSRMHACLPPKQLVREHLRTES